MRQYFDGKIDPFKISSINKNKSVCHAYLIKNILKKVSQVESTADANYYYIHKWFTTKWKPDPYDLTMLEKYYESFIEC